MRIVIALLLSFAAAQAGNARERVLRAGDGPRGYVLAGRLHPGVADRYSLRVGAGERISAAVVEERGGEFHDPTLALIAPGGAAPVASSDDDGPRFLPRLSHSAQASGRWTIVVSGFGDLDFDGSGHEERLRYQLLLTVSRDGDASPGPISLSSRATAEPGLLQPGDTLSYEVRAPAGATLHAGVFEPARGEFDDVVLRVRDSNGVVLSEDDDAGPGFLANLALRIPGGSADATRLFVELTGFDPEPSDAVTHREHVDYLLMLSVSR